MAQFCHRFTPKLNEILTPLYHLTKLDVSFARSTACENSFVTVKQLLTDAPVLQLPSSADHFILETHASDVGIGSCLKVLKSAGEHVVAYHSSKLDDTQQRWNIVEKEAFAIITTVRKHRHYLIGKRFTIRTDSRILTYIQAKKTPKNRKLLGWSLELSEFNFDIVHIPSRNNTISDCLSCIDSVNTIFELQPIYSSQPLLSAQHNYTDTKHGIQYVTQGKVNFDVNTLGSLKRFRKQLSLSTEGILLWKEKIVVPPTLPRSLFIRTFWHRSHLATYLIKIFLARSKGQYHQLGKKLPKMRSIQSSTFRL